jgi:hypothetical protein
MHQFDFTDRSSGMKSQINSLFVFQAVHDVMQQAADVSAGKIIESSKNSASGSDVSSHVHVPVV